MEPYIERKRVELRVLNLILQPLLIVIGPVHDPISFHVVVDTQVYDFDSCLKAFDFTFKVFFTFDCKYPATSSTLWLFVQKGIYNIDVRGDKCTTSINVLLGKINSALSCEDENVGV